MGTYGKDGVRRDCECKRARHEHGTRNAYVVDRCRCRPCRNASRDSQRERIRAQLYGRYDRLVDATEARNHIRGLMAAGMGWERIGEVVGTRSGVAAILYGRTSPDPAERRPPRRRIARDLHGRIMAVTLDLAAGAIIDGTGAARRLQALVAIGWTQTEIAARLGIHPGNLTPIIHGRSRIRVGTAAKVAALYDQLWDQPQDDTRARKYAARLGWVPPLAWDDDTIDDPAVTPDLGTRAGRSTLLEDLEWLLDGDASLVDLERLANPKALETTCRRAGRTDLYARYQRARGIDRGQGRRGAA